MDDNFLKAVEFAKNELQGFYDRGGSFLLSIKKGDQKFLMSFPIILTGGLTLRKQLLF